MKLVILRRRHNHRGSSLLPPPLKNNKRILLRGLNLKHLLLQHNPVCAPLSVPRLSEPAFSHPPPPPLFRSLGNNTFSLKNDGVICFPVVAISRHVERHFFNIFLSVLPSVNIIIFQYLWEKRFVSIRHLSFFSIRPLSFRRRCVRPFQSVVLFDESLHLLGRFSI
jgi:hypothetical protein